jgi:benzoylformate decarboxylase
MMMAQDVTLNIRETTFNLLRKMGLTTFFGNPGSTEMTFLQDFPSDFQYILALQEASVMAMADGYAQATGKPALVNVHTGAGLGNAIGNLITAYLNKTPLIVTAGQQDRRMLLMEPWLTNVDAEQLPKPWVKWSYQPVRAEDVPAAFMRAYAIAMQPPQGPVFLALPLDDWDKPSEGVAVFRTVSSRVAPDPIRIRWMAEQLQKSRSPVLVLGAAIDRGNGWDVAVQFAEKLNLPVFAAPASERAPFPESHPLYQGSLPFAMGPLSHQLSPYDLVLVIGAPVFRYYPYIEGDYLKSGTTLLHITDDPSESARAPIGDSLIGCPILSIEALMALTDRVSLSKPVPRESPQLSKSAKPLLSAEAVFSCIAHLKAEHTVLVEESPSNLAALKKWWRTNHPQSFFTFASGGLGWNLPAAVGIALGEQDTGRKRPVVLVIGDGSLQYSIQALWTAVQHQLPLIILVMRNKEYGILKAFAVTEATPGVPGLDIPGIDCVSLAKGYGMLAFRADTLTEVEHEFTAAMKRLEPTLIEIMIDDEVPPLIEPSIARKSTLL